MTVVNQLRFEALVRRHFSFARIGDQPTISRTGNEWRAAFAVAGGAAEILCDADRDSLETVVISDEEVPIASQHTGSGRTEERLEAAFAEPADDLRRRLE